MAFLDSLLPKDPINKLGNFLSGGKDDQTTAAAAQAPGAYEGITLPDVESMKVALKQLASQGKLSPEQYSAALANVTKMEAEGYDPTLTDSQGYEAAKAEAQGYDPTNADVSTADSSYGNYNRDVTGRNAQLAALGQLQDLSKEGMTVADKADLNRIRGAAASSNRGNQEAILQKAQERGTSGSALSILAQLNAAQNSANQENQSGLDVAAQAQKRALEALLQSGQLGGQIQSQDFTEADAKNRALDEIAKFNAAAKTAGSQFNANSANEAGKFGASANNAASLANQSATNSASQFTSDAANRASLANQAAKNSAAEFGAAANNTASQVNAGAANAASIANAGSKNQASQFNATQKANTAAQNLAEKQRIADANVGLTNQQELYNKSQYADDYDRQVQLANAKANAYLGQASSLAGQSKANKELVGSIIGAGATAGAGASGGAGAGAAGASGAGAAAAAASDERMKKDVENFDPSEFLDSLIPVKFKYKDPQKHGRGEFGGVMAQDVEKTPEGAALVEDKPDGKYLDSAHGFGTVLAALGNMHDRLKKVEGAA